MLSVLEALQVCIKILYRVINLCAWRCDMGKL